MAFVEVLKVIFIGIVEGITEWLPISSTGHMLLVDELINMDVSAAFREMFLVVIQLGAILAVVVLYWNKLMPFSFKGGLGIKKDTFNLWIKIAVASIPAGIIGVLFEDKIDELFFNPWTVAITLILYGVLFILIEKRNKNRTPRIESLEAITYKTALIIGVFQALALIPGTSRSGATIVGAILIGTQRKTAAEFTFFLAVPAMAAASLFKLVKFGFSFSAAEAVTLALGSAVAFAVSVVAIKFLVGYIKKHDFKVFGWYRIALGTVVIAYFAVKALV